VCLFPSELYTVYCCFCHFYGSAHKLEQFLSLYLCFLWVVSLSFLLFIIFYFFPHPGYLFICFFYIYLFLVLCFLHSRSLFLSLFIFLSVCPSVFPLAPDSFPSWHCCPDASPECLCYCRPLDGLTDDQPLRRSPSSQDNTQPRRRKATGYNRRSKCLETPRAPWRGCCVDRHVKHGPSQ